MVLIVLEQGKWVCQVAVQNLHDPYGSWDCTYRGLRPRLTCIGSRGLGQCNYFGGEPSNKFPCAWLSGPQTLNFQETQPLVCGTPPLDPPPHTFLNMGGSLSPQALSTGRHYIREASSMKKLARGSKLFSLPPPHPRGARRLKSRRR